MRHRWLFWGITALVLTLAPVALASRPSAESDATLEGKKVHQEINFWNPEIHYWIHVSHPEEVSPPFCVRLELEKKRNGKWRGLGIDSGQRHGVEECCPRPHPDEECGSSQTDSYWDLFLYPRGKLIRKVREGRIRIRGSTDLGASVTLRLSR